MRVGQLGGHVEAEVRMVWDDVIANLDNVAAALHIRITTASGACVT